MEKNIIFLILLMILLVVCIALMAISLLLSERVFGQVSGYISIASIAITLVGVFIYMKSDRSKK